MLLMFYVEPVRLIAKLDFFHLTFGDESAAVAPTLAHFKPVHRACHHRQIIESQCVAHFHSSAVLVQISSSTKLI